MISDKRIENDTWGFDMPLFRAGTFRLPSATGEADYRWRGYYNPVVDSIALRNPSYEVWQHETTHRIFSLLDGGCFALRGLGGISHSLLFALIQNMREQATQLSGRKLETLRAAHPHPSNNSVDNIVVSLKRTEELFDQCFWSLVPVAEMAAIDFRPGEGTSGWSPDRIEDIEREQKRKDKDIDAVATQLVGIKKLPYNNIKEELHATWKAYTSIKESYTRHALLRLTTTAVLQADAADQAHRRFFALDALKFIRDRVPNAHQIESIKLFHIERFHRHRNTRSILREISEQILGVLPKQFHRPAQIARTIDVLLAESPSYDETALSNTHPGHELAGDPYFGLLNYWFEPGGRHRVFVNQAYQLFVEHRPIPEIPVLDKDWWRELALFETLRLAIKQGKPVICPFLHWEGVTCSQDCRIRETVNLLRKHTELVGGEAVCTL